MWSRNTFTERLNLVWPILQAPMGKLTTPALAASVSNAGGLGGLAMWGFLAEEAARRIAGFRQQSGGVYLTIDTTSGERERGSLEPLLANPVARWELMLGKALAAFAFTAAAVVVQLVAFKLVFEVITRGEFGLAVDLGVPMFAAIFLICLPLMAFAVAIQLIVATLTRSFKETQTYLGLLPLAPALPGLVLVFVSINAHPWMMAIPTFGQTLLVGQLVRGEPVSAVAVAIACATTALAAAALLYGAARLYERDVLLFGAQ